MCRFVAYIGKENLLLANLLVRPNNSLIKQSLLARESRTPTNGDGFGVGWYTPFDKTPALFTSLFPAWNDQNLSYIARKTRARLFLPIFVQQVQAVFLSLIAILLYIKIGYLCTMAGFPILRILSVKFIIY